MIDFAIYYKGKYVDTITLEHYTDEEDAVIRAEEEARNNITTEITRQKEEPDEGDN